jgi:hypothetical protein
MQALRFVLRQVLRARALQDRAAWRGYALVASGSVLDSFPEAPPLPGEPEPSETPTLHAPATPKWENPDAHRETFRSTPLLLNGEGAPKSEDGGETLQEGAYFAQSDGEGTSQDEDPGKAAEEGKGGALWP